MRAHLAFLLLASVAAPAFAAGDPVAGKAAFAPCASCHQVGPSARAGFGPQLNGVLGRRAGSTPGFRYSAALKQSGLVWTEETIAAYVRNPGRAVPGTSMRFSGLGYGDRKMADLLAYLGTLKEVTPAPGPDAR